MNKEELFSIAQTIINQINYCDKLALLAWGATGFTALRSSKEFQGGAMFQVDGLKFQGYVRIELRWVDDYTVSFIDQEGRTKHKVECVYFDQLVDVIDWVEKGQ